MVLQYVFYFFLGSSNRATVLRSCRCRAVLLIWISTQGRTLIAASAGGSCLGIGSKFMKFHDIEPISVQDRGSLSAVFLFQSIRQHGN